MIVRNEGGLDSEGGREVQPLRIAIVSTPRTGNTWLRHLLASTFGLESAEVHRPEDVTWDRLPDRFALQLHWRRVSPLVERLDRHGFRVVVLCRHPLDMLLSLLHWVSHSPVPLSAWASAACLAGEAGNECALRGARPRGEAFLSYACGPRAAALLGVSREWWPAPGTIRVRYEDLVADTEGQLRRIARELGRTPHHPFEEVAARLTFDRMRNGAAPGHPQHYWKGQPGLWRRLLPAAEARRIAAAQPNAFADFGYTCDPDPGLDARRAEATWDELEAERAGHRHHTPPGAA